MKKIVLLVLVTGTLFVSGMFIQVFSQGFETARKVKRETILLINYGTAINARVNENSPNKGQTVLETGNDTTRIGKDTPTEDILGQGGLNTDFNSLKINLKLLKFYAQFGERNFLDFYILSSLHAVTDTASTTGNPTGKDLIDSYGGLLNMYVSKSIYLNKEQDYQYRGWQIEAKAGYRLTNLELYRDFLHSPFAAAEVRYLVPLRNKPTITDDNLAGILQIKAYGQMLYNNSNSYHKFFSTTEGKLPPKILRSMTIEASVFITNRFYLSGGYTFASKVENIKNFGFFKLTYSGLTGN